MHVHVLTCSLIVCSTDHCCCNESISSCKLPTVCSYVDICCFCFRTVISSVDIWESFSIPSPCVCVEQLVRACNEDLCVWDSMWVCLHLGSHSLYIQTLVKKTWPRSVLSCIKIPNIIRTYTHALIILKSKAHVAFFFLRSKTVDDANISLHTCTKCKWTISNQAHTRTHTDLSLLLHLANRRCKTPLHTILLLCQLCERRP